MSVTPMQLIRMDHKARFCFVFVFVLFYFVGHIIFPDCGWSLCKRLLLIDHTPFKMGWRSNRNFLGHLFDLAVYGLNCFCMLFFFFFFFLSLIFLRCGVCISPVKQLYKMAKYMYAFIYLMDLIYLNHRYFGYCYVLVSLLSCVFEYVVEAC